jgi:hypothetical protein
MPACRAPPCLPSRNLLRLSSMSELRDSVAPIKKAPPQSPTSWGWGQPKPASPKPTCNQFVQNRINHRIRGLCVVLLIGTMLEAQDTKSESKVHQALLLRNQSRPCRSHPEEPSRRSSLPGGGSGRQPDEMHNASTHVRTTKNTQLTKIDTHN